MKFVHLLVLLAFVALPAMALTGCTSAPAVRADMTNAADSTTRTADQDANDYARIIDHNTRGIWDDLARVMLIDKSSKLTPWVVP
ncbi:MAG: hypothetical protein AAGH92_01540 [Planctomycetota bacterium]